MDKKDIREMIIKERDMISPEDIELRSRNIFEQLVELPEYEEAENVLVYASMRSEVRTDEIILDALASGKKVFCPKVMNKASSEMVFIRILEIEDLKEGFYGIREPELEDGAEIYQSLGMDKASIVIVPGVAFDKDGNRIGYNGGFYDSFLSKHPDINTVALCYRMQFVDYIPAEAHDIAVKKILSEDEL